MAGMLKSAEKAESGKYTPEAVRAQMKVTPEQAARLDKIVLAGKKVMFGDKSHGLMLKQLNAPGTMAQKIGQGVAGLMGLLMQESRGSLPGDLIVPAGVILVAEAVSFLNDAGQQITPKEMAQAVKVMVTEVFGAVGVNADRLGDEIEQAGAQQGAQQKESA